MDVGQTSNVPGVDFIFQLDFEVPQLHLQLVEESILSEIVVQDLHGPGAQSLQHLLHLLQLLSFPGPGHLHGWEFGQRCRHHLHHLAGADRRNTETSCSDSEMSEIRDLLEVVVVVDVDHHVGIVREGRDAAGVGEGVAALADH